LNAFEVLGLRWDADADQVRAAYRSRAKTCHPDQFQDKASQDAAQEQMIRLNLAYEEAMRVAANRKIGYSTVALDDAKTMTRKLMDQKRYDIALRQLRRADTRDAEWFWLHGSVLMELRDWANAHQSFREAIRLEPENLTYRRGAFEAAKAVKKHNQPLQKAADAIGAIFGGKKRKY